MTRKITAHETIYDYVHITGSRIAYKGKLTKEEAERVHEIIVMCKQKISYHEAQLVFWLKDLHLNNEQITPFSHNGYTPARENMCIAGGHYYRYKRLLDELMEVITIEETTYEEEAEAEEGDQE